jgi:hypothetical protein
MVIRSSKTEHRPGGDSRVCPIFPELMPYLEEAFAQASEGAVLVIDRWQHAAKNTETGWKNVNLRTRFTKIIRRAEVEPWPKLWHNLRASRETELSESFPAHVVCKWIGNSPRVAHEHYLQVTEEHFQKAAQNPAQQSAAIPRKMGKMEEGDEQESPEMREIATICSPLRGEQIGPEGFERPPKTSGKTAFSRPGGALPDNTPSAETGLLEIVIAWPSLSPDVRAAILTIARQYAPPGSFPTSHQDNLP